MNRDRLSTPRAPEGMRWFRVSDLNLQTEGIWHIGHVPSGAIWPVRRASCGYEQTDTDIGRQETASQVSTLIEGVCVDCYRRTMYKLLR